MTFWRQEVAEADDCDMADIEDEAEVQDEDEIDYAELTKVRG